MKSAKDFFMEEREMEQRENELSQIPIRKPAALNKKQLIAQAEQFVNNMLKTSNPLELIVDIKRLEEFVGAMKAKVSAQIGNLENPETINGAKVEMMAGRMGWEFSDSPRWVELSQALAEYEGLMKKAAETPGYTITDENGEVVPPAVHKPGKPFLKITL